MLYASLRGRPSPQTRANPPYALLKFADQRAWHIDQWIPETGSGAPPSAVSAAGAWR